MPAKLLVALMLTVTCVVSVQYVGALSLRKSDDVNDDEAASRDAVVKRSAGEGRSRRHTHGAPAVVNVPVMADRGGARSTRQMEDTWSLLSDDERLQFASLLADAMLLEQLRDRGPAAHHHRQVWAAPYDRLDDDDLVRSVEETEGLVYGTEDGGLADVGPGSGLPMKRTIGHLRSPRELHPVYLGLGQNAASAALNTYASLLADEKRRESLEQQQQGSANPVRFIGKR